jgi:beta-lactamase regulating signal transducer with metallopeptidase domain
MEITVTDFFLIVWAVAATFAACVFHTQVMIAKRFTVHLFDNPELYADIRKSINQAKENHHEQHL